MVSIGKWLLFGLVGAFAISALVDPQRAFATTQAFKGVGGALGSLGGGIQSLFTGVGTGAAKLFNPLFTLKDLIYGPQAGLQTQTDVREIGSTGGYATTSEEIQSTATLQTISPSQQAAGYRTPSPTTPSSKPPFTITGGSPGSTWTFLTPVTPTSVEYYNALGVTPSPTSSQTTSSRNSGNATSASSASATYSAGAAQRAGYSTGSPR